MSEAEEERSPKRARTEDASGTFVMPQAGGEPPRVPWLLVERQALRQAFIMFGVGRWKEVHVNFCRLSKAKQVRTAGEVERAMWHLLQALRVYAADPGDVAFLDSLLQPVAHLGDLTTAGQPWPKVDKGSRWLMGRLRNLADFNTAVQALQQQPEVLARFRQLLAGMPDRSPPATWWNAECDVALLRGMYRAGYGEYDAVFADPEFLPTFKGAREAQQARMRELASATGGSAAVAVKEPAAAAGSAADGASGGGGGGGEDTAVAAGRTVPDSGAATSASDPSASVGGGATATADADAAAADAAPPSYVWPDGQVLTPRLRRLCELLLRAVRQVEVESGAVASGAVSGGGAEGDKTPRKGRQAGGGGGGGAGTAAGGSSRGKGADKAEVWSKKDRQEVLGLLMRFGLPHAAAVAAVAPATTAAAAAAGEGPPAGEGSAAVAPAAGDGVGPEGPSISGGGAGDAAVVVAGGGGGGDGGHIATSAAALGELVSLAREHYPRLATKSAAGIQQALRDLLTEAEELLGSEGHDGSGAAGPRTPRTNRHAPGCTCRICQNIARRKPPPQQPEQGAGPDGTGAEGAAQGAGSSGAAVGGGHEAEEGGGAAASSGAVKAAVEG